MRAADTNILARYLLRDDQRQAEAAENVLTSGPVFVSIAVCLELVWLLRSRYSLSFDAITSSLKALAELPEVTIEAVEMVEWALGRSRSAWDLSDLLLVIAARSCESFVTFDQGVAASAGDRPPIRIETIA